MKQGYENQQVHIVTRLDKDTSGVMLFAKHGYAHARLDKQLQSKTIQKRYYALVKGIWEAWSCRRDYCSDCPWWRFYYPEKVAKGGKYAHTSYQVVQSFGDIHPSGYSVTHRSNPPDPRSFSHIGFPLLGDDLYGGSLEDGIERQALRCHRLSYYHPFLEEKLVIESPLPPDFQAVLTQLQTNY